MTIDLFTYNASKDLAIAIFKKKKNISYKKAISTISVITMVPIIVVAFWIGEETNWPQEIIDSIQKYKNFYSYTEIKNKPKNSPI